MELNLDAFAGGVLHEKVNTAMRKVAANIMDPNTEVKAKRKIKITLTFQGKEPTLQNCGIVVDTVLAPEKEAMAVFGFGENLRTGEIDFNEYGGGIPGQITFADIEAINAEKDESYYHDDEDEPQGLREVK